MASNRSRRSVIPAWLRKVPSPAELPGVALALAGRRALRSPARTATGFVSNESPLIIAGMHRSGTSVITQSLVGAGVFVGGANVDEHQESLHFSKANRVMLGEATAMLYDFGWSAPKTRDFIEERRAYAERAAKGLPAFFFDRTDEPVWGWKDPRNCLTLDVWLSIFPKARVLHLVRDGRIVALSLADRDQLDPSFGLALWAHYVEEAEKAMATLPEEQRLTVRYEDFVRDAEQTVERLLAFAGIKSSERDETRLFNAQIAIARERDPRIDTIRTNATLERFGYGEANGVSLPLVEIALRH